MRRIASSKSEVRPAIQLDRVPAHQIAAATAPGTDTKHLLGRGRLSANARARLLNDFLADPKAN